MTRRLWLDIETAEYARKALSFPDTIDAGLAATVVCGFGRDSWSRTNTGKQKQAVPNLVPSAQRPKEHGPEFGYFGAVAPHAFGARRHMFEYGTTAAGSSHGRCAPPASPST